MKEIKKVLGIILTAVMMITSISTVSAQNEETTYSIIIDNSIEGHTYEAYQIFQGRLESVNVEGTDRDVLSDIEWGTGVNGEALLTELKSDPKFQECKTAADVAKLLSDFNQDSNLAKDFAKKAGKHLTKNTSGTFENKVHKITGLSAGYYLVKDKDGSLEGQHDAYTDFILKIVKDVTINPKSGIPTVSKKVQENSNQAWQDAADYNIGDEVPFQLTGTLPSNLDSYKTYTYKFHDTLSEGFTFVENSVRVYIVNEGSEKIDVTNHFTTVKELKEGKTSLVISCDNILGMNQDKLKDSSKIVVEYKAKLNEKAIIAGTGNPNEVYLSYSNNPNGEGMGKTVIDKVRVFTYELVVNKKDEDGSTALKGAAFTLFKKHTDNSWVEVKKYEAGDLTEFKFTGLDAGEYKLTETKAPAGYNKIKDILFKIEATYDKESDDPKLTDLVIKNETGEIISGSSQSFSVTLEPTESNFNIVTNVINKKGSILPETGGMGTTMFYIGGSLLMIGAVIALIAKKRKKAN